MCQDKFIPCAPLGGMLIMGKALVGDGGARYMKNPCTSSQVCFELKTAFFFFFFFFLPYLAYLLIYFAAQVLAVARRRFTMASELLVAHSGSGSLTRDRTQARCIGSLPTGPPGKSLKLLFKEKNLPLESRHLLKQI